LSSCFKTVLLNLVKLTLASSFLLSELGISCIGLLDPGTSLSDIGLLDPDTSLSDIGLLDILRGGFIQFALGQVNLTWIKGIGVNRKM
jgi:hypothetical protein